MVLAHLLAQRPGRELRQIAHVIEKCLAARHTLHLGQFFQQGPVGAEVFARRPQQPMRQAVIERRQRFGQLDHRMGLGLHRREKPVIGTGDFIEAVLVVRERPLAIEADQRNRLQLVFQQGFDKAGEGQAQLHIRVAPLPEPMLAILDIATVGADTHEQGQQRSEVRGVGPEKALGQAEQQRVLLDPALLATGHQHGQGFGIAAAPDVLAHRLDAMESQLLLGLLQIDRQKGLMLFTVGGKHAHQDPAKALKATATVRILRVPIVDQALLIELQQDIAPRPERVLGCRGVHHQAVAGQAIEPDLQHMLGGKERRDPAGKVFEHQVDHGTVLIAAREPFAFLLAPQELADIQMRGVALRVPAAEKSLLDGRQGHFPQCRRMGEKRLGRLDLLLERQARQCACVIHADYSLQTDPTGPASSRRARHRTAVPGQ